MEKKTFILNQPSYPTENAQEYNEIPHRPSRELPKDMSTADTTYRRRKICDWKWKKRKGKCKQISSHPHHLSTLTITLIKISNHKDSSNGKRTNQVQSGTDDFWLLFLYIKMLESKLWCWPCARDASTLLEFKCALGIQLIWTGHQEKKQYGVGIAIRKSPYIVTNNIKYQSERLMAAKIVVHGSYIQEISANIPTEKNRIAEWYQLLSQKFRKKRDSTLL